MKEIMLIIHFLGLVMTLGSVGSFLLIRKNSSQVNGYEYTRDLGIIKKFLKYAYIGIGVMILSGGYLMPPYWATFGAHPMIHVKMTLVVLWLLALIILGLVLRSAIRNENTAYNIRIGFYSTLSVVLGVAVVVSAVFSFH